MNCTLDLAGRPVRFEWYQQGLVAGALEHFYGREILSRAFCAETDQPLPLPQIFRQLKAQPAQLLTLTQQQIHTIAHLDQHHQLAGTTWINLSAELLADGRLFQQLIHDSLIGLSDTLTNRLILEIAEDDLADRLVLERVNQLKHLGFQIAMDDFGAGYSNIERLQLGGFDMLKLDLNLLQHVPDNLWAASFYKQMVDMATASGCIIVAEGVERQSQADFVRWAGVDIIQGFLYSKPQPLQATPAAITGF